MSNSSATEAVEAESATGTKPKQGGAMGRKQAESESKGCLIVLGAIVIAIALTTIGCYVWDVNIFAWCVSVFLVVMSIAGISNIPNKNVS